MGRAMAESLITKYDIIDTGSGKIGIRNVADAQRDNAIDAIKAHKAEILAHLSGEEQARKQAADEREAKISSIDGLRELEASIADRERYAREFDAMMDDEYNDGVFPPKPTTADIPALRKKYPRAAAYLMALEWSRSENCVKSREGVKALDRIIDGDDYTAALTDMEDAWHKHTASHMWD